MTSFTRGRASRPKATGLLVLLALALAALCFGAASAAAAGRAPRPGISDGGGRPSHDPGHSGAPSHHPSPPSHHPGDPSHHPGHPGHPGHPVGPGQPPTPPSHQPESDPLSAEALMATIDQYGSSPDHYSGTPADWFELNTIASRFAADGLQLGSVAYHFPRFEPTNVALSTDSEQIDSEALAPLLYSGTTGPSGIEAPLLAAGDGSFEPAAAAGKIVVVSAADKGVLDTSVEKAIAAGAKGLVYVTAGFGDLPRKEDVNSRRGTGDFPVLLVGQHSGADVLADASAGQSADLTLQANLGTATDFDVWGVLPGADPSRRVFVGTPASSFVPAASERGGGLAILLGLAKHYSEVPRSQRPESLVFLATTGHEVGFLGLEALIEARGSWFTDADAYVHMGASLGAPTGVENPDGSVSVTPVPPAGLSQHDSENPLLVGGATAAFAAAGQPLGNLPMHVSGGGEQVYAWQAGVPEISANSGSLWFHTAADLPSVVDPGILTRLAAGYRGAVDSIIAQPAGAIRGANGEAAELAAASPGLADSRAPVNPVFGAEGVGGPPPQVAGPGPWQSFGGW